MPAFLKYALYFGAVFILFLAIAMFAFVSTAGGSAGVVGWYMEYDHNIGQITAFKTKIGFYVGQKLYEAPGTWSHNVFYSPGRVGATDAMVARILANEDLQVNMTAFDPQDTRVVTAVKTRRQPGEFHPYPVAKDGDHPVYPPPKGMIKVDMLECDLDTLPWQPHDNQEAPPINLPDKASYYGTQISNGWPRIWLYRSDDPQLPELRVMVEKGHVTEVNGGAEDTTGIDYAPQPMPEESDDSDNSFSFVGWLIRLVLGK